MASSVPYRILASANVPASQTRAEVVPSASVPQGGPLLRFDVVLGRVAGTPSLILQQGTLPGIWADVKSQAAVAAAGTACTFTAGTNVIAATSHGLVLGQLVMFATAGVLPNSVAGDGIYQVIAVSGANSFEVRPSDGGSNQTAFSILSAGTGSHVVVACQTASITLSPYVAGDQAALPLRPRLRVVCTTAGGETAQVGALLVSSGGAS